MFVGMFIAYSIIFALIVAVICKKEWNRYYIWAKLLSSMAFFFVFVFSAYRSGETLLFQLMLPGFSCCFVGDIFMALYNRCRKHIYFLMGLGIFMAGHLCFARWLCTVQEILAIDLLLPLVAVFLIYQFLSFGDMHTGRLKPFILIYTFFVTLFFVKAQHLAIACPSLSHIMLAVGSALFLISDISILFLYFGKKKGVGIHIFNLATYYYGMFLLASQLLFL